MFTNNKAWAGRLAGTCVVAIAATGIAPMAFAEGTFKSSLTSVGVGFESRSWPDKDADGAQTSVSHYSTCTGGATSVTYGLMRERDILPDVNVGDKKIGCRATGTAYWGRVVAGDYHASVHGIAGASRVSVNDWRVVY